MYRTLLLLTGILLIQSLASGQQLPLVDQDRLEATLFRLADFGKKQNGETSRVAFSDSDIAGREYVMQLMDSAGLEVSIDYAGNIIGHLKGEIQDLKPLAMGSHIDMVPDGGNYDGIVGSLAAIEVVRTLKDNNIKMRSPLQVFIFPNEEGGVMGSRALAGTLGPDALPVTNSTGYSMKEGINRIGGDSEKLNLVTRKKGDLAAFLELHIEQGAILDQSDLDIGVVEGIVGINWWDIEVTGNANHAGTTPMDMRQDALLAAARFIIAVNEEALSLPGRHVATVGRIRAEPGAPNVIPGRVLLSLEIRDLSSDKINLLFTKISDRAMQIAAASGTAFSFTPVSANGSPALTDIGIRKEISDAAESLGLTYRQMQSGAGHDAQEMALIAPAGMIFVPSKDGISHSPKEFTSAADMANGANVLLHTLLALDAKNR